MIQINAKVDAPLREQVQQHLSIAATHLSMAKEIAYGFDYTTAFRLVCRVEDIDKISTYLKRND